MTHTRTSHPVRLWTGKQTAETALDRLIVLSWKGNTKTGREAHSARCFSLPVWSPVLTGDDRDYIDMLIETMIERQRRTAHKYVSEQLEVNGVCNDIPAELLAPEQMLLDFLQEQEESENGNRGKISGEQIAAWFNERLRPLVVMKLADKQGWLADGYQMTKAQEKNLNQSANGYRATLEKLAAPSPKVDIDTAKILQKAVTLIDTSSDMVARKLAKKLDTIINPPMQSAITLDLL